MLVDLCRSSVVRPSFSSHATWSYRTQSFLFSRTSIIFKQSIIPQSALVTRSIIYSRCMWCILVFRKISAILMQGLSMYNAISLCIYAWYDGLRTQARKQAERSISWIQNFSTAREFHLFISLYILPWVFSLSRKRDLCFLVPGLIEMRLIAQKEFTTSASTSSSSSSQQHSYIPS